jgi:hypothetical protein
MFQASTAHHQEVRCIYVANGTSKMAVSEPGWNGTPYVLVFPVNLFLFVLNTDIYTEWPQKSIHIFQRFDV